MTPTAVRRSGQVCAATGLAGALSAAVLLAWPAQVAKGPVRYPFTRDGFLVAQAFFFVHHWGLMIGVAALAVSGAVGAGRLARAGGWLALVGLAVLDASELLAMHYANHSMDAANKGLMGTAYGVSSTVVGLGMLAAGVGVLRAGRWQGWHRWIPLAIGVTEFVVVTPGTLAGFTAARLAIGSWMLLFGALGLALVAESAVTASPARAKVPATAG